MDKVANVDERTVGEPGRWQLARHTQIGSEHHPLGYSYRLRTFLGYSYRIRTFLGYSYRIRTSLRYRYRIRTSLGNSFTYDQNILRMQL